MILMMIVILLFTITTAKEKKRSKAAHCRAVMLWTVSCFRLYSFHGDLISFSLLRKSFLPSQLLLSDLRWKNVCRQKPVDNLIWGENLNIHTYIWEKEREAGNLAKLMLYMLNFTQTTRPSVERATIFLSFCVICNTNTSKHIINLMQIFFLSLGAKFYNLTTLNTQRARWRRNYLWRIYRMTTVGWFVKSNISVCVSNAIHHHHWLSSIIIEKSNNPNLWQITKFERVKQVFFFIFHMITDHWSSSARPRQTWQMNVKIIICRCCASFRGITPISKPLKKPIWS